MRLPNIVNEEDTQRIAGFLLLKTCPSCPEQYDVFKRGELVGYLRLRGGVFTASIPNAGGEIIYRATTEGDGEFEPEERQYHLNQAIEKIAENI